MTAERVNRTTTESYHQRILTVLMHIQRHLDEELTLESLATLACFSPFHFHRIFRGLVGESVGGHVRRLRLERAAFRLTGTDLPVVQVALEAGYESHEGFTRAFGAMFDRPPSTFRREGKMPRSASPSGVHYAAHGASISFRPPATGEFVMDVQVTRREPCTVAFVRHVGPYEQCSAAWEKLMIWAGPKGLIGPQTKCCGLSYDDPKITPADKIRYDACIPVDQGTESEGEVGIQEIAGGDYAVVTHTGPYDTLHETYTALYGQWLPQSGYHCRDAPPVEIYLNDPRSTPPEALRTEICVPLERA